MSTPSSIHHPVVPGPVARPVLLWVFRRDVSAITAEVGVDASGRCEVRVIPHWDPSLGIHERFANLAGALQRHAEIAHALCEIGWTVADRVPMQPLAA